MAQTSAGPDLAEKAKAVAIGTKVDITLAGGLSIRGRVAAVDSESVTLDVGRAATNRTRRIPFRDIVGLKVHSATHTPVLAWVAVGAIAAVVVVAISVLLIERHNEGG